MGITNGKVVVDRLREATADERKRAEFNRDPLTLLSAEDRQRYLGQWVVIQLVGSGRGTVVASGQDPVQASREAKALLGAAGGPFAIRHLGQHEATH